MSGRRDAAEEIAERCIGFTVPEGLDDALEPGEAETIAAGLQYQAERILDEARQVFEDILALADELEGAAVDTDPRSC